MIKLFKKVRQKLLEKNRLGKYLLYAVGEIFLVVIGILIALQINNWNTQRINQQKEKSILEELKEEYMGKQFELNQKIGLRNLMISSSSQLLFLIKEEEYNISEDSLANLIALTTVSPTFDASNSVTDELLNSGNLYIIEDKDLRKLLLSWPSELAKLEEEEQNIVHILLNNYMPFINKHIPYNNLAATFLNEDSEVWQYIVKTSKDKNHIISKSNKKVDIKSLFSDIEFESFLATFNFASIVANMQSNNLNSHIEKVMNKIDRELSKD